MVKAKPFIKWVGGLPSTKNRLLVSLLVTLQRNWSSRPLTGLRAILVWIIPVVQGNLTPRRSL